jgi:hypothetical protein
MTTNRQILTALKKTLKAALDGGFQLSFLGHKHLKSRNEEWIIKQLYESKDKRGDFRLRLSGMGKSLLTLQCEKLGLEKDPREEPYLMLKFMFGDMIESLVITLLEESGIEIQEEQEGVTLELEDGTKIKGTLDIVIDGRVYDIKTASPYAFEKFKKSLETLEANDSFGYCTQLAAYAKAGGYNPGGWIVVNKSTAEVCICDASELDVDKYIESVEGKVAILEHTNEIDDVYKGIPYYLVEDTGRKYLNKDLKYFDYKEALGWKEKLKWHWKERNWEIIEDND